MSIEVFLFTVIGIVAIVSAVMMLISENAVNSALFLILNFACVAFLYILLDASFLAMVQIAVYAGAIMVLFLFVIMLLGAEKAGAEVKQFKWLSPVALTLAMSLLISMALAVLAGEVDEREVPDAPPLLRVAHTAGAVGAVDIYLNGELAVNSLEYGEATDYTRLTAGEYNVTVALEGTDATFPVGEPVFLSDGQTVTLLAYGEERLPELALIAEDLSTPEGRDSRLLVFNAYAGAPAINFIDPGPEGILEEGEVVPVIFENLAYGALSEPIVRGGGTFERGFVASDNPDVKLLSLPDLEVERGTSNLVVLTSRPDPLVSGAFLPAVFTFVTDTFPQFGSPQAIGQALFIEYVLPFQMVAVLLLAAMVGAIVLTQRGDLKPKPGRPTRRKVSRPLTSVIASQTGHNVYEQPEAPRLAAPEPDEAGQPEPAGD
ncbi:MAG: hypothetical protein OHK0046_28760 [Anaerolineae bacterium]